MAGKLFMYNGDQQQFVERGYGILKINESHDPEDWDRLQARLSNFICNHEGLIKKMRWMEVMDYCH